MGKLVNRCLMYGMVVICTTLLTFSGSYSLNQSGYLVSAVDGAVVLSYSGWLGLLILPLIVSYCHLYEVREDFKPVCIVRRRNRMALWNYHILHLYGKCVCAMMVSMITASVICYSRTQCLNNILSSSGLCYSEFVYTGQQMPEEIRLWLILPISLLINSGEFFVRALIGLLVYWMFDSQVITIICIVALRLVPGRMYKYYQMWHFKEEAGAYYTELCSWSRVLESMMLFAVIISVVELISYYIVRKKDFYK